MRKLIHKRGNQDLFDGRFLFLSETAQPFAISLELALDNLHQEFFDFNDCGSDVQRAQLLNELLNLRFNDCFRALGFSFSLANIRLDDRVEIVDVE